MFSHLRNSVAVVVILTVICSWSEGNNSDGSKLRDALSNSLNVIIQESNDEAKSLRRRALSIRSVLWKNDCNEAAVEASNLLELTADLVLRTVVELGRIRDAVFRFDADDRVLFEAGMDKVARRAYEQMAKNDERMRLVIERVDEYWRELELHSEMTQDMLDCELEYDKLIEKLEQWSMTPEKDLPVAGEKTYPGAIRRKLNDNGKLLGIFNAWLRENAQMNRIIPADYEEQNLLFDLINSVEAEVKMFMKPGRDDRAFDVSMDASALFSKANRTSVRVAPRENT